MIAIKMIKQTNHWWIFNFALPSIFLLIVFCLRAPRGLSLTNEVRLNKWWMKGGLWLARNGSALINQPIRTQLTWLLWTWSLHSSMKTVVNISMFWANFARFLPIMTWSSGIIEKTMRKYRKCAVQPDPCILGIGPVLCASLCRILTSAHRWSNLVLLLQRRLIFQCIHSLCNGC